jgi:acetylglutamate kinase
MKTISPKKIVIIKLGGNVLTSANAVKALALQLCSLQFAGFNTLLVHGGGNFIDQALVQNGIAVKKDHGIRITDATTMTVVQEVLDKLNGQLENQLRALGINTLGCNSASGIISATLAEAVVVDGQKIDLGLVGSIESVSTAKLCSLLQSNVTPLVAPIAAGPKDSRLNINADDAAASIASSLNAHALLFLSDVPGVLVQETAEPAAVKTMPQLTLAQWQELVANGTVNGGMIPKLKTAFTAALNGVKSVQIIDGTVPGSILKAITQPGSTGTLIAA